MNKKLFFNDKFLFPTLLKRMKKAEKTPNFLDFRKMKKVHFLHNFFFISFNIPVFISPTERAEKTKTNDKSQAILYLYLILST